MWTFRGLCVLLAALLRGFRHLGRFVWGCLGNKGLWRRATENLFCLPLLVLYGLQRLGGMPPETESAGARTWGGFRKNEVEVVSAWLQGLVLMELLTWAFVPTFDPTSVGHHLAVLISYVFIAGWALPLLVVVAILIWES